MTSKNNTFIKIVATIIYILAFSYVFLWETNFIINSRVCLLLLGLFLVVYIIALPKVHINKPIVFLFLFSLINFFGTLYTPADFDTSIMWCGSLFIATLFMVFSFNCDCIKRRTVLNFFLFFCLIHVLGVYLNFFDSELITRINEFFLKSSSFESFLTLTSYKYYLGFSGFNIVPSFFGGIASIVFLSRAITKKRLQSLIFLILSIVCVFSVVLAQKRGILIAVAISDLFIILIKQLCYRKYSSLLKTFVLFSVGILIFYFLLNSTSSGQLILKRFFESSDISSGRFETYRLLLADWKKYFLLGNGPVSTRALYSGDAHNIFIQVFFENGIFGVLFLIFILLLSLRLNILLARKNAIRNDKDVYINLSFIGIQILFIVYGLFGNPLSDLFFFLTFIIFFVDYKEIREQKLLNKNGIISQENYRWELREA